MQSAVEHVLFKALAKAPADRYPSGAARVSALRVDDATTIIIEPVPPPEPVGPPRGRPRGPRWRLVLGGLVLVALAAVAIFATTRPPGSSARATSTPVMTQTAATGGQVGGATATVTASITPTAAGQMSANQSRLPLSPSSVAESRTGLHE